MDALEGELKEEGEGNLEGEEGYWSLIYMYASNFNQIFLFYAIFYFVSPSALWGRWPAAQDCARPNDFLDCAPG